MLVKLKIKLTFTKYRRTMIIDSAGTVEFCPRVSCVAFHFLPLCDFHPSFCAHLLVNQHLSPLVCSCFLFLAFRFLSLTPLPLCSLLFVLLQFIFGILHFLALGFQLDITALLLFPIIPASCLLSVLHLSHHYFCST